MKDFAKLVWEGFKSAITFVYLFIYFWMLLFGGDIEITLNSIW